MDNFTRRLEPMHPPIDVHSEAWKPLSEDQRFLAIKPICQRFSEKYCDLPSINHIGHTEGWIYVSTALPHGTIMDELPATFEGITLEQDPVREQMDLFIATWTMILDRIGGWAPRQIADWANDRNACFQSVYFLHDSPIDCVAPQLLSERLWKIPGIEIRRRIEDEILAGLSDGADGLFPDLDPDFDWEAARFRVSAAIREMENKYVE